MLRSIAFIHFFLVLQSQMARISNKRMCQPKQPPDSSRYLDSSSYTPPVRKGKRKHIEIHSLHSQQSSRNGWPVQLGTGSRITLRLTHRRHQRYQGRGDAERDRSAPLSVTDPSGGVDHEDDMLSKGKDREYWLRHLRPRSSRDVKPAKAKSC